MAITDGYVTQAQAKTHIDIADNVDNDSIDIAVTAASRAVDIYCGRRFYLDADVSARRYHPDSAFELFVDDFSTLTGLVVATDTSDNGSTDETWTITTDFEVEPANNLAKSWAVWKIVAVGGKGFLGGRRARNHVTAKWGWPSVPDEVFEATLLVAARLLKRRDTPTGVAGFGEFGVVRITSRTDPDAAMLLGDLRHPAVG
jgi:hypothetical protein